MKILFVCKGKYNDIRNWSGTVYHISKALENLNYEVMYVDNLKTSPILHYFFKIMSVITKNKYLVDREPINLRYFAKQIEKLTQNENYDVIFSPSSLPITYLNTNKPIIIYTDATFKLMIDYYNSFTNISKRSLRNAEYIEKMALDKATLILYSSEWARNSAIRDYNISAEKVKVVNFGLNIDKALNIEELKEIIDNKKREEINLLFLGVDWIRKGGVQALKITKRLNELGFKAKLFIVGCNPIVLDEYDEYVEVIGFLNKDNLQDRDRLLNLFKKAHFLLLPTQQEAYGIVFAEASAYGLPSITTNTGGVEAVVKSGVNGYCFDVNDTPNKYAEVIGNIFSDYDRYYSLCINSYYEYVNRLNWNVAGKKINEFICNIKTS